jgi:hypothetical protein
MGLLDKVKSLKNAVTGGAAKVYVDVQNAKLSEPFEVTVRAQPQGCDVKFDRVYLDLEGIESVEVPDYDFEYEEGGEKRKKREIVRKSAKTVDLKLTVADAGEIKDGETAEWKIEVNLPDGSIPDFRGRYARHSYRIRAGLDCFGNDPDSGWIDIRVS